MFDDPPGPFPLGLRTLTTSDPHKLSRSPELGRSPFWERPSRALPGPEDMPQRAKRVGQRQCQLSNRGMTTAETHLLARTLILWRFPYSPPTWDRR